MQRRFGIPVALLSSAKDQVLRCLERIAIELRCHVDVERITSILTIDYCSHPSQCRIDLVFSHDTVVQPVGNVLARDSQRRPVLHQPDVVDVGYFRAAHALVYPAHHVTENTLAVVVEFRL